MDAPCLTSRPSRAWAIAWRRHRR